MPSRTILLVEDDINDEHLTLRALRLSGVPNTVVVAHTGAEALDFLLRTGPFDGRTSPDPMVIFVDNARYDRFPLCVMFPSWCSAVAAT
jgi:two-component system response regulator